MRKENCVSDFLYGCFLFLIPSIGYEINRAGGELRALARAPSGKIFCGLGSFSSIQLRHSIFESYGESIESLRPVMNWHCPLL